MINDLICMVLILPTTFPMTEDDLLAKLDKVQQEEEANEREEQAAIARRKSEREVIRQMKVDELRVERKL